VSGVTGAALVAALAGTCLAVPAPPAQRGGAFNDRGSRFSIGVLRRDGILVPFASFDGKRWNAPWPDSDENVTLPIALGDVPKRWWGGGEGQPWTAWVGEPFAPQPLALEKPVHFRAFCGSHVGISTRYRGGAFDTREPTVPKDGVAIAAPQGAVTLKPITRISTIAADGKRMIAAITDTFNEEEAQAARRFTAWLHPFGDAQRRRYPIELEALYRARETSARGEWSTNYVEAVRRFPAAPQDKGCGLITFVRGWVIEREGKEPVINIGARVTYCDRADVSFMLPFGRVAVDDERYWVYQTSSWRDEFYSVARVRPDEVQPVVAVAGGGCPREPLFRRP